MEIESILADWKSETYFVSYVCVVGNKIKILWLLCSQNAGRPDIKI